MACRSCAGCIWIIMAAGRMDAGLQSHTRSKLPH
jgi:hypothetical protein